MQIGKKVFSVENYYKNIKVGEESVNINIPLFEIFSKERTVILADKKSAEFCFNKFWANFSFNDYASYSLYTKDFVQNNLNLNFGREEVFKAISFFDISKLSDAQDEIPLIEIWKSIKSTINAGLFDIKNDYKNNEIFSKSFKAYILKSLSSRSWNISEEYKALSKIISDKNAQISSQWFTLSPEEMSNILREFNSEVLDKIKTLFNNYFDFYNDLYDEYKEFNKSLESDNNWLLSATIKHKKKQLMTLHNINKQSVLKVENSLLIRDTNNEILYFKKYKKFFRGQAKKIIDFIFYKINKAISTTQYKMSNLKSTDPNYFDLYKELLVKKHSLKVFSKYKNKINYLTTNQIIQIEKNLKREERLFVTNVKIDPLISTSALMNKIKNFYGINIDQYVQFSKDQYNHIKKEINQRVKRIRMLKSINFDKIVNSNREIEESNFKKEITILSAEKEWNDKMEFKMLEQANKLSAPKIKNMFNIMELTLGQIDKNLLNIRKLLVKKFGVGVGNIEQFNLLEKTEKIVLELNNFSLATTFIDTLWKYTTSHNDIYNSKFENEFKGVVELIESFNTIEIDLEDYLTQFKNLPIIAKIKLKLLEYAFLKQKIIMVQDNPSFISRSERIEFLKVLNSLAKQYGFTYVFITNDSFLATKYFDYVYIMFNNSLVEAGYNEDLKTNSFHPVTKSVYEMIPLDVTKRRLLGSKGMVPWIHGETIFLDQERHYLFSSIKEYQIWSENNIKINKEFFNTEEINYEDSMNENRLNLQDPEYIYKHYRHQYDGLEVFITNINNQKIINTQEVNYADFEDNSITKEIANEITQNTYEQDSSGNYHKNAY
ncbi:MAG1360 family OppF-related protein [Mycoplasmopsis alligatoris]|uniref:ABC transporter domain-containing protein n=1 Tax=Mycoplasmopsis alligatoris A21JP2 TaxID=747682 RepID=D4XW77_9BACT|nr:hypothetical protein [Mycoplasmopsis alligatoris]EFF41394.1 hypothetical protein MALL_0740 [Mycoplasmopsis alligatoris A21JP2]